jgi:hypothetical protein
MMTMPMSTPSTTSPAGTRKSEPPAAAGCDDALALGDGLAAATDRDAVGDGATLADALVVGVALRDADALAVPVGVALAGAEVGTGVVLGVGAGEAVVVLVPSDAQARESLTPGAEAHTDRAAVTHELPSAAVRASDTRMNG